ncbi:unnamed protein product [Coccothraustes coccothraustes]
MLSVAFRQRYICCQIVLASCGLLEFHVKPSAQRHHPVITRKGISGLSSALLGLFSGRSTRGTRTHPAQSSRSVKQIHPGLLSPCDELFLRINLNSVSRQAVLSQKIVFQLRQHPVYIDRQIHSPQSFFQREQLSERFVQGQHMVHMYSKQFFF